MSLFNTIYRAIRKMRVSANSKICKPISKIVLLGNNVKYGKDLLSFGIPTIDVWRNGIMEIGDNFSMNNGDKYNVIGRQQKCMFVVRNNAKLSIGDNVGISSAAIICTNDIKIGNNVIIGGNSVIYDTDFHSLNYIYRLNFKIDQKNAKTSPVVIGDNVFIGAHSTILKGVKIGKNSIVGACSLVAKDIPENEIWAGNPAKFIKVC